MRRTAGYMKWDDNEDILMDSK